jgi:dolichol-phosphate mannosyltransferase
MAGVVSKTLSIAPAPVLALRPAPELCIVVPTFNERGNVPILVEKLSRVLGDRDWEVLFVDDNSPDGTAAAASAIGETDSRVRCLRRIGRRGRAGACLEGMLASQARYLAIMDGGLLHDETLLVAMLERLHAGSFDLVVASRHLGGEPAADPAKHGANPSSRWNALGQRVLGIGLTDPLSGYFMIRRHAFEAFVSALSSQSTSILLDLLFAARGRLRVAELAGAAHDDGTDGPRGAAMALELAGLAVARLTHDAVSIRFLMFCLVGLTGVGVHMAILGLGLLSAGLPFAAAQTAAAVAAMAWNFTLNNLFTYRDQRLAGRAFVSGLIRFQLICAIGAISNVGAASLIYNGGRNWWVAGLGGVLMGAVWNYAVTSVFVWRKS